MNSRRGIWVTAAGAVAAALAAGGCGVAEATAASVNGQDVDRTEFERELRAIRDNATLQKSGGADLLGTGERTVKSTISAGWLNTVLQDLVVTEEFQRRKLKLNDDDRKAGLVELEALFQSKEVVEDFPEWFRDKVGERYARAVAVRNAIAGIDLSKAGLNQYYEKNKDKFSRVCAAHILVATREEADAILGRLNAGEDFAAVARQVSLDTGSAPNGGDLGPNCAARGEFVTEFEQVAFEIPVGTVSDPVQTQFGFHLIKVRERPVLPFAAVEEQVRALVSAEGSEQFGDFLRKALADGDIEVDPRYGTLNVTPGRIPQVQPPELPGPPRTARASRSCPPRWKTSSRAGESRPGHRRRPRPGRRRPARARRPGRLHRHSPAGGAHEPASGGHRPVGRRRRTRRASTTSTTGPTTPPTCTRRSPPGWWTWPTRVTWPTPSPATRPCWSTA